MRAPNLMEFTASRRRVRQADGVDWEREGIVGRGILIDYEAYCAAHDLHPEIFKQTPVTVADLKLAYEWQGLSEEDFWEGDILFIRFGYIKGYYCLSDSDREW